MNDFENLGYVEGQITPSDVGWAITNDTPNWVYNSNYWYWTMSQLNDSESQVWFVSNSGALVTDNARGRCGGAYCGGGFVRPVIVLSKSVL